MIKVGILGDVDKRIFAYSIIRILSELGTAIWITSNQLFLCAAEDNEDRFTLGDGHFLVTDEMERVFDQSLWDFRDYDYILYDCNRVVPDDVNVLFHIVTPNARRNEFQDEIATLLDTSEKYRIFYCSIATKSDYLMKGMAGCEPHVSHILDVQKTESERVYASITDVKLRKTIAYMLSKILPGQTAETLEKRLSRKGW